MVDVLNFSREDIALHLAELGYTNITEQKMESFIRDLRKLIKHEERKKSLENRLGDMSSRSEPSLPHRSKDPPDTSTSPDMVQKPRRRVRRKEKKTRDPEDDSLISKYQEEPEEPTHDTPDLCGRLSDTQQSSLYIDVDLPLPDSSRSLPEAAPSASLLTRAPAGGFIRARSGPGLGRRPASSDPVALHQRYRETWEKFPVPGERSHNRLRWQVRGWMMGEEPL